MSGYFTYKPSTNLSPVSSGTNNIQVVSGYYDAEPYVIPSGYTGIFDGKEVTLSGFEGTEVYLGVQPGDYPTTADERSKRTSYLSFTPTD